MKTSQTLIVLGAILAICVIPSVLSLRCYICNSLTDGSGCGHGSDADKKHIKECSEQAHQDGQHDVVYKTCRKIVTWIDFDVNNNTATERIVRKCGYIESKYDTDCYYRGGFGGRQQVCSCKTDDCNSGFTFRANHILMGAGALMVLVFGSRINNF
ncbi:hypothetical protein Ocin01_11431 [Orchesella cincta]|uniref:Uncharacterized protein n=1 Tax=Orchesella cincta TaxID=48709 RepID=A0A1D2MQ74_ORCCI|nr:hypothetical protein Ocin01_11431 [Orchesella cincta]